MRDGELTRRDDVGTRWLQKWGKELNQGSRLAYFGLTTLLGTLLRIYAIVLRADEVRQVRKRSGRNIVILCSTPSSLVNLPQHA